MAAGAAGEAAGGRGNKNTIALNVPGSDPAATSRLALVLCLAGVVRMVILYRFLFMDDEIFHA